MSDTRLNLEQLTEKKDTLEKKRIDTPELMTLDDWKRLRYYRSRYADMTTARYLTHRFNFRERLHYG
jgi:hypothetical protein